MIDIVLTSFCSYSAAYFSLKYFGKIKYFKKTEQGMKEFTEKDYTYTNILHVSLIIMYISSNYLIVSGEHRVHFNTNFCSRFCCTPRPFQAYEYPLLLLYLGGVGFHPSHSTGVCAIAAVYFKAISPMTQFHRFLVSLHMHDNPTYSFRISPCPLCSLLRISGLRYSSEIGSSQGVFYVY